MANAVDKVNGIDIGDIEAINGKTDDNIQALNGLEFVGAGVTGGTETTYSSGGTDYKVHTFTSTGTFTVAGGTLSAAVLVVAGLSLIHISEPTRPY